ncbi:MAG: hypothetical protein ACJAYR_002181 [Sneathiella sp.]|jgi:hypothetical protein
MSAAALPEGSGMSRLCITEDMYSSLHPSVCTTKKSRFPLEAAFLYSSAFEKTEKYQN